jgi:RNA polymerase sigma-70 factor (ECF subfamily)
MKQAATAPGQNNLRAFPASRLADAELVQLLREGRQDAAGAVWDRYAPMVRRVIRRALSAGSETEDLVQEVFLRFVDMLPRLRDPDALAAFLYGIASRYAISELRRRQVRRMVRLSDSGTPPDVPIAPAQHDVREVVTALYRVLDRLRPRERVVFILHDVEGLEFSEVAVALRVSESTAKRAAASGRQRLARLSEGEPALRTYLHEHGARLLGGSV